MAEGFSRDEEKRLQKALETATLDAYPNPDRIGCPKNKTLLRDLSAKTLAPTNPLVQHVAECSSCFREVVQFRKESKRQSLRRVLVGAAVCALVSLVVVNVRFKVFGRF